MSPRLLRELVQDRNLAGPQMGLPLTSSRRDDAPMGDYNRYCPVSMGSDVIADRWTPLIVRELVLGNTRFNDIARGLPGISRARAASTCSRRPGATSRRC